MPEASAPRTSLPELKPMVPMEFDKIDRDDLLSLIRSSATESRTIDFKAELPGATDSDKKEYLADVSSLANAAGGDLLYGVEEGAGGVAAEVPGLPGIDADREILRLEETIRSGIEPRIIGVRIRAVDGFSAGPVILIRVPKSWSAPHMVAYKGTSRFYTRDTRGKHQLDVHEIRHAFSLSEALPEKIRHFREERVARIVAGETPLVLPAGAKTVLHLLPLSAFDPTVRVDVARLAHDRLRLSPMWASVWDSRYNFDGFASFSCLGKDKPPYTYVQAFRNGALEAVDTLLLQERTDNDGKVRRGIPGIEFEEEIMRRIREYLQFLQGLELQPPVFVLVALLGVKGYDMAADATAYIHRPHPIEREDLLLPDVMFESYKDDPTQVLRPVFDAVWQSAGFPGSLNYDEAGKWTPG